MAACTGDQMKVYMDVTTDSVYFPNMTLLWLWQKNGDNDEVTSVAYWRRIFVLTDGNFVTDLGEDVEHRTYYNRGFVGFDEPSYTLD